MATAEKAVLLSIRTPYAELITSGIKRYELRRKFSANLPTDTRALIYASGKIKQVIGEGYVKQIHYLPLDDLWRLVCRHSMISWDEYKTYFAGLTHGYAIEIIRPCRYKKAKSISTIDAKNKAIRAPQSYCYVNNASV